MMSRRKGVGALVAPALLLSVSMAHPASAALDKCASSIESNGTKLEAAILKSFQACDKEYRKAVAAGLKAGKDPDYTAGAGKCQAALAKNIGLGNGSTMDKTKASLDKLVPKTCTQIDLLTLGHLPQSTFGDEWSRSVLMSSLNVAYVQEIALVRDTVNMFQAFACAPKTAGAACLPTDATTCASCKTLIKSPCYEHACSYLTSGLSAFDNFTSGVGDIQGTLIGSSTYGLCSAFGINPTGEYLVIGGTTGKGIQPIVITGLGFACSSQIGGEGYVNCPGGSGPLVNYQSCQDSNPATQDQVGGCAATLGGTPDACTNATVDTVNGGFNGGACTKYATAGTPAGAAFINNLTALDIPLTVLNELGPDGKPCTDDDTEARAVPSSLGLTTGTASVTVLDFGNGGSPQSNGPITGAAFPCGNIQSSNLSGATIAGAFPAVSQPVTNDAVVTFTISCQ